MTHSLIRALFCLSSAAVLGACSSNDFGGSEPTGTGGFAPQIALNAEVVAAERPKAPSRAEASEIVADNLGLRLTSADGSVSKTWDLISDFNPDERFKVGTYTLEAFYGDENTEGFGAPYFIGSQTIEIEENKVTPVSITARLGNAMVSLDYTEAFASYMSGYKAEVHSAGGATTEYAQTEVRPVYVKAGLVEVYVDFVKPNGKGAKLLAASFTAQARHHYHVTFDLSQSTGDAVLRVIYDETLNQIDEEIDLSDELLNMPAPVMTATGFTSGEPIRFVPGNAPSDPLGINIIAQGKLARVTMTTHSASLLGQGWPAEINLVGAESSRALLASLGLTARGLFSNPEKMAVIDLTGVLQHITLVDGDDNNTQITFVTVDTYGKASDEITLLLVNEPLNVSLADAGILFVGGSELSLTMNYNGGNPAETVAIQYFNDLGTWSNATAAFTRTATDTYSVQLSGLPADARDLRLRAKAGSAVSDELTVKRTPVDLSLSVAECDVYATRASAPVKSATAPDMDITPLLGKCTLHLTAGGAAAQATVTATDGILSMSGLTPGTTYEAYLEVPGSDNTNTVTFTTEASAQIPGSDMEQWYSTDAYGKKSLWVGKTDIKCWYPGTSGSSVWATRNPRTTGQTSGTTCYYTSFSGTIGVAGNNGGQAAEISTLGYGEGTTYAHTGSGAAGSPKKKIAGLLFTGTYSVNGDNETVTYGIPFTSRPSALTFNYKFVGVNNESFRATVVIENRAGGAVTELGRGEFTSAAAKDAFTPCTVNIAYSNTELKATHAYVIFESTTAGDNCKVYSRQGSDGALNGYSDSKYIGTQLTVDDISLTY